MGNQVPAGTMLASAGLDQQNTYLPTPEYGKSIYPRVYPSRQRQAARTQVYMSTGSESADGSSQRYCLRYWQQRIGLKSAKRESDRSSVSRSCKKQLIPQCLAGQSVHL